MSSGGSTTAIEPWPLLPLSEWRETCHNLHMWTQIVGKVRLALTPRINHWWNVPLYVGARGLTTSPVPYEHGVFEVQFDFVDHLLVIDCSDGRRKSLALEPRTVSEFYADFMSALRSLGIEVAIYPKPVEVPDPVPFADDRRYRAYDADAVRRFWQILVSCDSAFKQFRARFLGKCSPVHFFWGSFDIAVTRFSGRRAPERPEADAITREAYSHEVISAGWWPGGSGVDAPAFYSYAAPEPEGFAQAAVRPNGAFYHPDLKGFIFPYDAMRSAKLPENALLEFMQSVYEAGATLAGWEREALEVRHPAPHHSGDESMPCTHTDQIIVTATDKQVCEDCVKTGDSWVHLRLCLACGHTGCCDSSKNKHATRHFHQTEHPLVRSIEPGESWIWCYVDEISPGEIES